jgi:hypothetical protein
MSLVNTFVDAFKKAVGKQPDAKERARSDGLLGPTDKFREAPESDTEKGIDRGTVSSDVSVASADPEEGGEYQGSPDVARESGAATSDPPTTS